MRRRNFLTAAAGAALVPGRAGGADPYPLFYTDAAPFRAAIAAAAEDPVLPQRLTGLTVPHHLLAADLIAQAFRLASGGKYRRLVIVSPDHFKRGKTPFSTTTRRFTTPLGAVPCDTPAARQLLSSCPLAAESSLFSHEHGVQAVLPFAAHWFRGVPVLAITCGIRTTIDEWQVLATALEPLLTDDTLLVQSTDFSHYLTAAEAAKRDAETLRVLAAGDPAGIRDLTQPDHIDSLAAMWLQMTLQPRRYRSAGTVIQNRNAIHYGGPPDTASTTSYVSMLWSPDRIPAASLPGDAWFFGGDTHFGRFVAEKLTDHAAAERITQSIRAITGGRPLVVNLEGILLNRRPDNPPGKWKIRMERDLTLTWLRQLGITAVVLANNHTGDAGPEAAAVMRRTLESANIRCLGQGEVAEFPAFRLAAATDLDNNPSPRARLITPELTAPWSRPADPRPLFAFIHAGTEYESRPSPRQLELSEQIEKAGAVLITGCHPHRPTPFWERTARSLRRYSLGNLLFDQKDALNTGGLLEVRFFRQGTWAARWHDTGNLFSPAPPADHAGTGNDCEPEPAENAAPGIGE